ncbi:MAG TPA: NUDIX domain-containing protein, partial [Alphaproteobacteria bacterium]|nr:NUDIX domain-containing protein [Alphaproteobacteria bacterium]
LPQGAVGWFSETNAPESTLMAARRENFEEFGFGEKEILQLPSMTEHHWYPLRKNWSHYDFNMVGCSAFLVRDGVQPNLYTGNNDEDPEFDEWKLIDLKDLPEEGPSHKRMPYTAIARDFAPVAEALKAIAHIQLSPEERAAHVWRDAAVQTAMREGKLGDDIPAFSGVHLVSSHDKAFKAHRSSRLNSRSEHSAVLRAA